MSDKKTPKETFLEQLINISKEFEGMTGCELERIDFHRLLAHDLCDPRKSIINYIELTLK
jgi:hypothetical protein